MRLALCLVGLMMASLGLIGAAIYYREIGSIGLDEYIGVVASQVGMIALNFHVMMVNISLNNQQPTT